MSGLDSPSTRQVPGSSLVYGAPNHVAVSVDMSSATWNTVATHEVFTVTGDVQMKFFIKCTETLTDATDTASIQFGPSGATSAFVSATGAAGLAGDTIEAGEIWADATPSDTYGLSSSMILDWIVAGGVDVGYEITGEALTDGTIVFNCWWYPLSSDGSVVAGAGGAL